MYKRRTGDKRDGCATFYKTSKFKLDACELVEYRFRGVTLMDRDNVGIVVRLTPVMPTKKDVKLIVGNTHILFNPRRGDIKLAQLQTILAKMDSMAWRENDQGVNYHPTMLCGDFNSRPHCDLYRFLTQHRLRYEGLLIRDMAGESESGRDVYMYKTLLPKRLGITDHCQYYSDLWNRAKYFINIEEKRKEERMKKQKKAQKEEIDSSSGSDTDKTERSCAEQKKDDESETNDSEELGASSANIGNDGERSSYSNDITKSRYFKELAVFESGELQHHLQLRSVYQHLRRAQDGSRIPRDDWEASTYHGNANCNVDYILYSCQQPEGKRRKSKKKGRNEDKVCDKELKLCARLDMLTAKEMVELGMLPNEKVSSDHIILMAKFALAIRDK